MRTALFVDKTVNKCYNFYVYDFDFLKKCGTYYLATVEGDQPRVRPFGTIDIFEDKLYIQTGKIKEVRGIGLMIGIEFYEPKNKEYAKMLFDKGILVGTIGQSVFRLVPPLVITKEEADVLIKNLWEILKG